MVNLLIFVYGGIRLLFLCTYSMPKVLINLKKINALNFYLNIEHKPTCELLNGPYSSLKSYLSKRCTEPQMQKFVR